MVNVRDFSYELAFVMSIPRKKALENKTPTQVLADIILYFY
jgi:hypothetical protein